MPAALGHIGNAEESDSKLLFVDSIQTARGHENTTCLFTGKEAAYFVHSSHSNNHERKLTVP